MTTIAERVAAGAAFLDEHEPGWADRVNLKRLYIGSTCNCMLGQLRGEYLPGVRWMRKMAPGVDQVDLGFMFVVDNDDMDAEHDDINGLTAEWKRVIGGRRAAA